MKTVLMAAWANDTTRNLMRWVALVPLQIGAWYSVQRFVGESLEAASWTWMVGFAFMMFTEKSAPTQPLPQSEHYHTERGSK